MQTHHQDPEAPVVETSVCEIDEIAAWLVAAEVEIAAYRQAVFELYGAAAAEWATSDWLRGLESMGWPPCRMSACWRDLTLDSASKLADCLDERQWHKQLNRTAENRRETHDNEIPQGFVRDAS